jgi:glycosyltransferase involved in cell wall biosynthesis
MEISKPRLLVLIVAYHAARTIKKVVQRIPPSLLDLYNVEILIIDDCSADETFSESVGIGTHPDIPFKVTVLNNSVNQGYGGNQKIGYQYAIENGFDFVALLHGDGQYAPELLPALTEPLRRGEADAVFGSRMMNSGERRYAALQICRQSDSDRSSEPRAWEQPF